MSIGPSSLSLSLSLSARCTLGDQPSRLKFKARASSPLLSSLFSSDSTLHYIMYPSRRDFKDIDHDTRRLEVQQDKIKENAIKEDDTKRARRPKDDVQLKRSFFLSFYSIYLEFLERSNAVAPRFWKP